MDIPSLKVADLKAELSKRNLPTTGLKQALADRLKEALEAENPTSTPSDPAPGPTAQGPPHYPLTPSHTVPEPTPLPADEDPLEPTTAQDKQEMIMGDVAGDLGVEMEVAQAAGETEAVQEIEAPGIVGKEAEGGDLVMQEAVKEAEETKEGKMEVEEKEEVVEEEKEEEKHEEVEKMEVDEPVQAVEAVVEAEAGPSATGAAVVVEKRKRDDEEDVAQDKRPRLSPTPTAPPPTRALYISNIRRPLQNSELKELLEGFGELDDQVEGMGEGFWVNGVKSHCYCAYIDPQSALTASEDLESLTFPRETGLPLHTTFLPPTLLPSLISHEKSAWSAGRTRLELQIRHLGDGQGYEQGGWGYELEKVGAKIGVVPMPMPVGRGGMNPMMAGGLGMGGRGMGGVPPRGGFGGQGFGAQRGPPLAGVNTLPLGTGVGINGRLPPTGPSRLGNPIIRTGPNFPPTQAPSNGGGGGTRSGPPIHPARMAFVPQGERKMPSRGYQRTVTRPVLFWREAAKWVEKEDGGEKE